MEGSQIDQFLFDLGNPGFDWLEANICFHILYHINSIGYVTPILSIPFAQAFSPPVAGLAARPPTPPPGLLPHHYLPVAGGRPGGFLPAPGLGRRDQPGPQPGPFRRQLLLPAPLLPFFGAGPGPVDPIVAADPPAFVPPLSGAGQRPPGRAGRWP